MTKSSNRCRHPGGFQQAKAAVDSDAAKVKELADMVSFEKVTAPFDGTITAASMTIGALIAANGTGGVMPLFRLAETDVLRVWVSVPQSCAVNSTWA